MCEHAGMNANSTGVRDDDTQLTLFWILGKSQTILKTAATGFQFNYRQLPECDPTERVGNHMVCHVKKRKHGIGLWRGVYWFMSSAYGVYVCVCVETVNCKAILAWKFGLHLCSVCMLSILNRVYKWHQGEMQ